MIRLKYSRYRLSGKVYTDDNGNIYTFGNDGYCDYTIFGMHTEVGVRDGSFRQRYTVKGNRMYLYRINYIAVYEIEGNRLVKAELEKGEIPREMYIKEDNKDQIGAGIKKPLRV